MMSCILNVLLLLHLLLLEHLLLLVLAQPIELIVLHGLFLLNRHRQLLIWVSKEVILFYIWLIQILCISIE